MQSLNNMGTTRINKTSIRFWLRLGLLSCLIVGQLTAETVWAEEKAVDWQTDPIKFTNGISYDYEKLLWLTMQIQTDKLLYDYLNKKLDSFLMISEAKQILYGWPAKSKGLSEHQILAILQNSPDLTARVETYFSKVSANNLENADIIALRKTMKSEFEDFIKTKPELIEKLHLLSDQTQAYEIQTPSGKPAVTFADAWVNHPRIEGNQEFPPSDLKGIVKDFIGGAKSEVWANFFDFDLMDVAEKYAERATKGVTVNVGIDANVIAARPEVKAVADYLETFRSKGLNTYPVDSVGLNHMKIIVRDPNGPNAAVLVLSGNQTQSCIGPEGDLVQLPKAIRPKESVANANNAALIQGELPALFARHQLIKIFKMGMRGQSGFPIGGAYKFLYPPTPGAKVAQQWAIIGYSPNGGMGDVNTDILKQIILTTSGPLRFLQFAFSSKVINDAIALRIQRARQEAQEKGLKFRADIGGIGDATFALREFSSLLTMSGLQKSLETNIYSEDLTSNFAKAVTPEELKLIRSQIYAAPNLYSERSVVVNGQSYPVTAKIHHKVMLVPDYDIVVAGTSFNFSVNAESNNEQIVIFRDSKISRMMAGAYEWLRRNARGTVYDVAMKRNENPRPPKIKEKKDVEDPLSMGLSCEGLF